MKPATLHGGVAVVMTGFNHRNMQGDLNTTYSNACRVLAFAQKNLPLSGPKDSKSPLIILLRANVPQDVDEVLAEHTPVPSPIGSDILKAAGKRVLNAVISRNDAFDDKHGGSGWFNYQLGGTGAKTLILGGEWESVKATAESALKYGYTVVTATGLIFGGETPAPPAGLMIHSNLAPVLELVQ